MRTQKLHCLERTPTLVTSYYLPVHVTSCLPATQTTNTRRRILGCLGWSLRRIALTSTHAVCLNCGWSLEWIKNRSTITLPGKMGHLSDTCIPTRISTTHQHICASSLAHICKFKVPRNRAVIKSLLKKWSAWGFCFLLDQAACRQWGETRTALKVGLEFPIHCTALPWSRISNTASRL